MFIGREDELKFLNEKYEADDGQLYLISAYFLMRAVMRMNSHDA